MGALALSRVAHSKAAKKPTLRRPRHDPATLVPPKPPQEDDLFEVSGRVKWFNLQRGYGFIVPHQGGGDVLLHATCLKAGGHTMPLNGSKIVCMARSLGDGRMRAEKIILLDNSVAPTRAQGAEHQAHDVEPVGEAVMVVKNFSRKSGYGFFEQEDGPDIFVHVSLLRRSGLSEVSAGQRFLVRYGEGPKGLCACEVLARPG